jgi:hypothetical protein
MKHTFAAVIFALIIVTTPACAAIEKNSVVCDTGICFYWWPTLPAINGWHQDKEQSFHENANVLAPDGSTSVDAETVIYANAVYKPRGRCLLRNAANGPYDRFRVNMFIDSYR